MKSNESNIPTPEREPSAGELFSRDLDKINAVIIDMLTDEEVTASDLREAWTVRADLTEEFIDSLEPTEENPNPRPRVQFDIMVDKAIIFETVGNNIRYLEELDTAEAFALNSNLESVSESIGEELDAKISELGLSAAELVLKLRGVIDFSRRDYLRDLLADGIDYEDLIDTIHSIILKDGGNPDEVLLRLGIAE